jgi:hypothetical protein
MIEKGDVRNWHWWLRHNPGGADNATPWEAIPAVRNCAQARSSCGQHLLSTATRQTVFGVFDDAFSFLAKKELVQERPIRELPQ